MKPVSDDISGECRDLWDTLPGSGIRFFPYGADIVQKLGVVPEMLGLYEDVNRTLFEQVEREVRINMYFDLWSK